MVPLIGGMAIGAERVLGLPPEAVISYDGFWGNDKYLMQWYEKRGLNIPYYLEPDAPTFSEVDVVTSLCPCSGLTPANSHGASPGCQQNRWMLTSTKYALSKIKPRILVGENAARLYSAFGQPVAATMRLIAEEYGYHLVLYKTDTRHHGLPQTRGRAFFVLYNKDEWPTVPVFDIGPETHTPYGGTWVEFLNEFPECDGDKSEKRWGLPKVFEFVKAKDPSWFNHGEYKSSLMTLIENGWGPEFIAAQDPECKEAKRVQACITKLANGGNIWDGSAKCTKQYHPSVMYRSMTDVVHPRGSSLTPREHMRLMGLPEDMDVPSDYVNAIAQNVPSCTAEWIVRSALSAKCLDNPPELSGDLILRQNNVNGKSQWGMPYGYKFEEFGFVHTDCATGEEVAAPEKELAIA